MPKRDLVLFGLMGNTKVDFVLSAVVFRESGWQDSTETELPLSDEIIEYDSPLADAIGELSADQVFYSFRDTIWSHAHELQPGVHMRTIPAVVVYKVSEGRCIIGCIEWVFNSEIDLILMYLEKTAEEEVIV